MNETETAWVAGLLEGEGCFVFAPRRTTGAQVGIQCHMTDKDVIERLDSLVPGGHIYLRKYSGDKSEWKPLWQWQLHRRPNVIPVLEAIRPYMGERRGKRIDEILEYHAANPRWASREGRKCEPGCSCGRHKDHIGSEQRSSWHKGKPKSEEHRRKISESHKKKV